MNHKNENGREQSQHNKFLKRLLISLCLISISMIAWKATDNFQSSWNGSSAFAKNSADGMPKVVLSAVSAATVSFTEQTGQTATASRDIPLLVLFRNGKLTVPAERTLIAAISNLEVPEAGFTVTIRMETQHGDPDLGGGDKDRITIWQETRWIDGNQSTDQTPADLVFNIEFTPTSIHEQGSIPTPTDYYRVEVLVQNDNQPTSRPIVIFSQDHAFLLEQQWTIPIPYVGNPIASEPHELVVYACDMFPFQKDASNRIPRSAVAGYIQTELMPQMLGAIQTQTQGWGFSWEGWTSFDNRSNSKSLGVALSDGKTWFHGPAPDRGNSSIAINVNGGDNTEYETLIDGIMSTFHHELFHNLQRAIATTSGGSGDVVGKDGAWLFFAEGTASFVSSVAQPQAQFSQTNDARAYIAKAVQFVGGRGFPGELNTSYADVNPYHGAIYWRFLYEQCGGMIAGIENPRAGMGVIRRSLQVLYSKEIVDIEASTDLVGALPEIMDRVLTSPEAELCPFSTFQDSLVHFSQAIYSLRLEGGRCSAPGIPHGCGFYDPNYLYSGPKVVELDYDGEELVLSADAQPYPAGIRSSYGIDFIDVQLKPGAGGEALKIAIHTQPQSKALFHVKVIQIHKIGSGGFSSPKLVQVMPMQGLLVGDSTDATSLTIPASEMGAYNWLGIIITRVDASQDTDPTGAYKLVLTPGS
jgi:hypothetical protein